MQPAKPGYYGDFGGAYMPEVLLAPIHALQQAWDAVKAEPKFTQTLSHELAHYAGRPTPLTAVPQFAKALGHARILLKREDLLHTGAHKLNNALGQCLLAKKLGKTRIIAETGAGQHGVATAAACARLGLHCIVYMGSEDMKRQAPNVLRMQLMGATVVPVDHGAATLKDAINEALRDWSANFDNSYYCLGSALGPHPYPEIVASFQSVIGTECKTQAQTLLGHNPDYIVASVGGGSNAIGIFSAFLQDEAVALIGVEAGGHGKQLGEHAARFQALTKGVLHGCYTYVLQNEHGQIAPTASISAGLDYPAVGPQHAELYATQRASYQAVSDTDALTALKLLAQTEGIIAALESAHALAYAKVLAPTLTNQQSIVVNLSGRGDKDLPTLMSESLLTEVHL